MQQAVIAYIEAVKNPSLLRSPVKLRARKAISNPRHIESSSGARAFTLRGESVLAPNCRREPLLPPDPLQSRLRWRDNTPARRELAQGLDGHIRRQFLRGKGPVCTSQRLSAQSPRFRRSRTAATNPGIAVNQAADFNCIRHSCIIRFLQSSLWLHSPDKTLRHPLL